jgi:hypothetical protein
MSATKSRTSRVPKALDCLLHEGDRTDLRLAHRDAFVASDTWIHGAFALEQGFIFSSVILAATTVAVIERRFTTAALWCSAAAALSDRRRAHSMKA